MAVSTLVPHGSRVNTRKITQAEWHLIAPHPGSVAVVDTLERWYTFHWGLWSGVSELAQDAGVTWYVAHLVVRRMREAGLLEVSNFRCRTSAGRVAPAQARLRYEPKHQLAQSEPLDEWVTRRRSSYHTKELPHNQTHDVGKPLGPVRLSGRKLETEKGGVVVIPGTTRETTPGVNVSLVSSNHTGVLNMVTTQCSELDLSAWDEGPRRPGTGNPTKCAFTGPYQVGKLDIALSFTPGVRFPTPATDQDAAYLLWRAYCSAYRAVTGKRYGNWRVKLENVHKQKWYRPALEAWKLLEADGRVHPLIWAKWFLKFSATSAAGKTPRKGALPFGSVFSPKTVDKWLGLCWHEERPASKPVYTRRHREQWHRRQEAMMLNLEVIKPGEMLPHVPAADQWYLDMRRAEVAQGHLDPNDLWPEINDEHKDQMIADYIAANPFDQFGEF